MKMKNGIQIMKEIKAAANKGQNDFKKFGSNSNPYPSDSDRFVAYNQGYNFAKQIHDLAYLASLDVA